MVFPAGRSAVRLFTTSSVATKYRAFAAPLLIQRVTAAYSTLTSFINEVQSTSGSAGHAGHAVQARTFATRPASKPKAHTGRTSTTPRKTKAALGELGERATRSASKASLKAKAKAKPKAKPKSKAKSGRKTKRPLTEKGLERAAKSAASTLKKKLREEALKIPTKLPTNPFTILIQELSREGGSNVSTSAKAASTKYKEMQPHELEHYNHIANQNKILNEEAFQKWLESYTPDQIRKANLVRSHLKRIGVKSGIQRIQDQRRVKRPRSSTNFFQKDRWASGDMHGINLVEATKLISNEWKALPEFEKEKYYEEERKDRERYTTEHREVYGRDPEITIRKSKSPPSDLL